MDPVQLKQLKQKVEEELRQREQALLEYWLKELQALEAKRHRDLASLQTDLRTLVERMSTRLRRLKGGSP
jgi:predicted component of type VI protein secretion system